MSSPPSVPNPAPLSRGEQARWLTEEVRPHESALRGYLHSHFPGIEADDVVQESYLKLLKARAAGKIASTKSYFFSVARNTALTLFRRRRIYTDVPISELPDCCVLDERGDSAEYTNDRQRFDLAVQAIERLPGRCREIFKLAALQRLSPAQIAQRLNIAESTVHVQLARGIKKCARYLREQGEGR